MAQAGEHRKAREAAGRGSPPDGSARDQPPRRLVSLAARALQDMRRHARESLPAECCGALIGRLAGPRGGVGVGHPDAGEPPLARISASRGEAGADVAVIGEVWVARALPLRNVASEKGRYRIAPEDVRRAEAVAGEAELDVVGFYHSHPSSAPVPSRADVETAWPWYSYLVLEAATGQVRAWRLAEDRSVFLEEDLRVQEGA